MLLEQILVFAIASDLRFFVYQLGVDVAAHHYFLGAVNYLGVIDIVF